MDEQLFWSLMKYYYLVRSCVKLWNIPIHAIFRYITFNFKKNWRQFDSKEKYREIICMP